MWEEGEVTLGTSFTERFGRGEPGGSTAVRREQRKKKGLEPNRYMDKGVSLVDALLRYKGSYRCGMLLESE
jgi:hypothetical protein